MHSSYWMLRKERTICKCCLEQPQFEPMAKSYRAFTRRAPDYIIQKVTNELSARFTAAQLTIKPPSTTIHEVEDGESSLVARPPTRTQVVLPYTVAPQRPKTFVPSMAGRFSLSYVTTTGAWQAYMQLPSWISQSVLELQSKPTAWTTNYSFRVYNVVSSDSEIVGCVRNGDKKGVIRLFNSRQASPFDKDHYGHSLLYVSHHH